MPEAAGLAQAPLLATKLFVPRQRPTLVARQALAARLDAALVHPLTLVSAPAGFGKTTLVSSWLQGVEVPSGWLALDAADNDPARFLRYLLAALRQAAPDVGQALWAALDAGTPPPLEAAVAALLNELAARRDDLLLVLDDCHTIDAAPIQAALQMLVAHQPPSLHLLLITREDPPLPLARLRARGALVELRAQDLRFTSAEVAQFLDQVMALSLTPEAIAQLDDRIEGWVAGLQLAALSLQHRPDPAAVIAGLGGTHHFILSYLAEEVLRRLPADTETFLLQTSLLERLTGSLCNAVTGRADSADLLEHLYRANIFVIPLDDEHRWYRYHHLFADLLRHQLQRLRPGEAPLLHARASAWYETEGLQAEAIEHALAAGNFARSVQLLEINARQVVLQGYAQTVETWLQQLPEAWQAAGPRTNLAFGWSLLLRGQPDAIEPYLRNAEAAAATDAFAGTRADAIRAETLALRAAVVSLHGDTARSCDLAQAAVDLAPADDSYARGMTLFSLATACNYAGRSVEAIAHYRAALPICRATGNAVASMLIVANLTMLYIARGQLHAAANLCTAIIAHEEQGGRLPAPAVAAVYGGYSNVLYEWGEMARARGYVEQGLQLSRRGGHVAAIAYGSVVFSRILQAEGDLDAATAALAEAQALAGRGMPAWVAPQVTAQRVALALARQDLTAAEAALAQSGVEVGAATSHTREVIHIAYLRWLLQRGRTLHNAGDLAQALVLAGRILASAEPAERMGRVLETFLLRAVAQRALNNRQAALADLRAALILGESEGYLRLFVAEGEPVRSLLVMLAEEAARQPGSEVGPSLTYVVRLLAPFPPLPDTAPPETTVAAAETPRPQAPALVEPLSARELEVLALMARDLTYEEVAGQLIVSLNTVRFHVKSIYGKLGVERRGAALTRARDLGIL